MQLSDLARAPRALLQEKIFIFVSSVLLMLSAAATRVFISHYLIYRSDANTNLVQLLEEQNLPYRNETRNAILAAVQSIFFGSGAVLDCESPEQSADEKRLCRELDARHRSFEALTSALECPIADTDNKCAMQVADRAMSSWPDGNPRRHDITLSRLRKAIPELVAGAPHARIQPCVVDPINASVEWRRDRAGVHTQVFGASVDSQNRPLIDT